MEVKSDVLHCFILNLNVLNQVFVSEISVTAETCDCNPVTWFSSDEDDEEEQHSAEEDGVDLGDSVTDGSEEDDEEEDDGEEDEESDEASGSDEEESGLDSEEDSDSGPDLARGKGNIESSSDEDDDEDVDAILRKEEEEIEHDWGELCKDAPRSDEVRRRDVWSLLTWPGNIWALTEFVVCWCLSGYCPTGRLQHGLGPDESQRPAGSAELIHT